MIFRVAILQMRSVSMNKSHNTEIIISNIKRAAKKSADILLLPECFITSYELPIENYEALKDNDDCMIKICNAAKESSVG